MYAIKEIFKTLQGEGGQAGRTSVFCRFSGCNLWSGRETDRATAACQFCDTDFVGMDGIGGGRFEDASAVVTALERCWGPGQTRRYVVFTGGEPFLQLDTSLIDATHAAGFDIAVETNGTITPPDGIDWLCLSPKAGQALKITRGQELKLVFPQVGVDPASYLDLEFSHFFIQPMDGADRVANTQAAIDYCRNHPEWRLSVQTHKILGIP
jgi:7-carboxy-7-deazaguanine synthase